MNERGGYALVSNVMRAGGPPKDADASWPFINFFTRQGFGAFARERGALTRPMSDVFIKQDAVMELAATAH